MKIKQALKLADRISILAILFWLAETIFFCIRDGWHWSAETIAEEICDNIFKLMIGAVIALLIYATIKAVKIIGECEKGGEG